MMGEKATDSDDEVREVEVGWGAWGHDEDLGNIYEMGKYWILLPFQEDYWNLLRTEFRKVV